MIYVYIPRSVINLSDDPFADQKSPLIAKIVAHSLKADLGEHLEFDIHVLPDHVVVNHGARYRGQWLIRTDDTIPAASVHVSLDSCLFMWNHSQNSTQSLKELRETLMLWDNNTKPFNPTYLVCAEHNFWIDLAQEDKDRPCPECGHEYKQAHFMPLERPTAYMYYT